MNAPATASAPPPSSGYPVTYDVEYPQELSRWLIFVNGLLAIPHLLILYLLVSVAGIVTFIAFFAILFTRRYPRELFNFVVGIYRWSANVSAYIYLLRDEYPPFSMESGRYPLTYEVEYPDELSRWMIFVKWLLVIPHLIVILLLGIAASVALVVAWFAILLTKRFPESLFRFIVGVTRWSQRATAYVYLLTDKYPPFSMDP